MKSLKLDESGDLVFENGSFVVIDGDDELAQQIRSSYKMRKGEWFLDEDEGMEREPFFTKLFNEDDARDAIIDSTSETSEPLEYEDIIFTKVENSRRLQVDVRVKKSDGETLVVEGVEL